VDLALLLLAAFTTLLIAGLFVDFAIGHRRLRFLKDVAPAQTGPPLSVLAAARNEARGIEAAATSLLRLDYPALEIVIVNDRSTDETGAILERLSTVRLKPDTTGDFNRGPALKVVDVTELPDGWLGKNYALHVGADLATGDLLLFTDADIVFEPTTLRRAVALMEEQKVDHLAVIPDIVVPGVALNAFVAAFGVFFSMYARPWKVSDPRSRAHIGVGAFNLIRAEVYRAIGGHRAIAMRPDDDMKLGKLVKKHDFHQDVAVGRDMVTVEWYASVRELIDGLMKNAFAGVDYSLWKVVGATAALFLMDVWPFLALLLTDGTTRLLNAVSVVLIVLIFWTVNGTRVAYVLAFPLAALLFIYIMWRSALIAVLSGKITWRGTAYPLSQMRANRI
jgi:cellulose synthase/poly-beta-1,6-N-acetylglucosamine synthase-like glycosyltransferase